jgi:hypothetical protein
MDILTACLLFLLYLAPSIPVAFEAGGGSGYLAILFLAVLWFVALGEDDKRAGQTTRLFPMALRSLCLVALVPALLRSNWRFSFNDLGWWAVAAGMSYLLLNRVVRSSSLLAGLYILAGTVNAGVGGFQHIVISPAERAANLASPEVLSSPGWGFGRYAAVGQAHRLSGGFTTRQTSMRSQRTSTGRFSCRLEAWRIVGGGESPASPLQSSLGSRSSGRILA